MCDPLCRTHRQIPTGTAVTGAYLGHRFTGVVARIAHGIHWCLPAYIVQVDQPFTFMGEPRDSVTIDITETERRGQSTRTSIERIPPPPGVTL